MRAARLVCVAIVALIWSYACSSNPQEVAQDMMTVQDADVIPSFPDGLVRFQDVTVPDERGMDLPQLDTALELKPDFTKPDVMPACGPGEGCFEDKCVENANCSSRWCVEHLGEGVCTMACEDECPSGWSCRQVGAGPDVAFICVSDVANLCRPCASGEGCKSPGGAEDVCVDYGETGAFCGGMCETDEDCPWGFSCAAVITVEGVDTMQCLADAGECPCTDKAIALGLSTPCELANEFGVCPGKRVCFDEGLGQCDAAIPAQEVCNGKDDNCDGEVDEPTNVGGEYLALCDDGNECTADTCLGEAGCQQEALTGDECKDGNPCSVADHCEAGVCVGSPVECDDENVCTDDSCDETGGCVFDANLAACDDGDACTVADQCADGECTGFAVDCECLEDADCAKLEDGDACNGTLACDLTKLPHLCVTAPDSLVVCPAPEEGPDSPCLKSYCEPGTGECSVVAVEVSVPCDDGNSCTVGDGCADGLCQGEEAVCDDGNPCTDDSCLPESGCAHEFNGLGCDDLNPCTLADLCLEGACVGQSLVDCDDENPCTKDLCGADGLCVYEPLNAPCSDGDACTVGDACQEGQCVPGAPMVCDDLNPCTTDSCSALAGCIFEVNDDLCDDGNKCTLNDQCVAGVCVGQAQTCFDGNPCTTDVCDPDVGCTHTLNESPCEDGDPCTYGDKCALGECQSGVELDCDDGNACTADDCQAGQCVHADVGGDCDDGNDCTQGDSCTAGKCVWTDLKNCDDQNQCTFDTCSPTGGCTSVPADGPCEDGDPCTYGDSCSTGECIGGDTLPCSDDSPCTLDYCEDGQCVHDPQEGACDDGNPCTDGDTCIAGKCLWLNLTDCDDSNVCTSELCEPGQGCVYAPVPGACDDNDECTLDDQCDAGECLGGEAPNCDDANACTTDSCDVDTGCVNEPHDGGCTDNDVCTQTDSCVDGQCVGGNLIDCNDGNQCTADVCDEVASCQYDILDGQACDDGNGATFNDKCNGDQCQGSNNPCGPNLKVDPQQVVPGWTLCYLDKNAPNNLKNAQCSQLFDSGGKTYGCWHSDATYPHENQNNTLSSACKSGVQHSHTYAAWGMCCHIYTVCIKNN